MSWTAAYNAAGLSANVITHFSRAPKKETSPRNHHQLQWSTLHSTVLCMSQPKQMILNHNSPQGSELSGASKQNYKNLGREKPVGLSVPHYYSPCPPVA